MTLALLDYTANTNRQLIVMKVRMMMSFPTNIWDMTDEEFADYARLLRKIATLRQYYKNWQHHYEPTEAELVEEAKLWIAYHQDPTPENWEALVRYMKGFAE
jgi:hypothetical protein